MKSPRKVRSGQANNPELGFSRLESEENLQDFWSSCTLNFKSLLGLWENSENPTSKGSRVQNCGHLKLQRWTENGQHCILNGNYFLWGETFVFFLNRP